MPDNNLTYADPAIPDPAANGSLNAVRTENTQNTTGMENPDPMAGTVQSTRISRTDDDVRAPRTPGRTEAAAENSFPTAPAPGNAAPTAPATESAAPPAADTSAGNPAGATSAGNTSAGNLKISVVSSIGLIPVENATITISYTGDPTPLEVLTTDSSGQTSVTELPAPPLELSLQPENEQQPYSEYNIEVTADGYEPVLVSGSEIFAGELSLQPIQMNPLASTEEEEKIVIIPAHTLFGNFPPKIPEDEIKPMAETGEIVLSRVVIPEYVIVHDGVPSDPTARNYWVRYRDYIKNVASCEIYSTWPENALYANILVIMSFTLNRVYTEWYRNQGYNFTITSSTAYDQKWVYGRNIFENIDYIVDTVFANYLSRPGVRQPIFTSYCDGKRVTCSGLSQWGSAYLAEQGYSAIEIIRYYYGNDMYINTAEVISGVPSSWPGYDLGIGSSGEKVRQLQNQLNRIARNYPAIPTVTADGIYGPATAQAIRTFQGIFNLPQTGVTDYPTWYEVSEIYVGVSRISEPGS